VEPEEKLAAEVVVVVEVEEETAEEAGAIDFVRFDGHNCLLSQGTLTRLAPSV
jgi:hypothetical protein